MGVALTSCTVPEAGRPTFDIDDDQMIMDDETLSLWDAPVHTAALRWGC